MPKATAPVLRAVLIVAHGSPSDPEPQDAATAELAERIAALLPGWRVRGATLAGRGTLKRELAALGRPPLVYPLFMSDGWFVSSELPRRLAKAGAEAFEALPPLGLDAALHVLCLDYALKGARSAGLDPAASGLILAAHGSPSDPRPRAAAERAANMIAASGRFREVATGFVDEPPHIADTALRLAMPALCLPFFAARAGHMLSDVPDALAEAGFEGPLLDPIGLRPEISRIVADALLRQAPVHAA